MAIVFVHGGVSGRERESLPPLDHAVNAGAAAGNALDAVERAVRALEDDPALNAGFGSVLNQEGGLELDAGIADGARGRCGGVANVTVRHPISLARRVMEQTPHVLLTGAGAIAFAGDAETLEDTSWPQRDRWQRARDEGRLGLRYYGDPARVDTVGAVALDDDAGLAAGSSTGGVFGKLPGRVGDAPVFGAGIYASEEVAVVGTGIGELFLATNASLRVGHLVEGGTDPAAACAEVIELLAGKMIASIDHPSAGLLALDRHGRFGAAFRGGSWAVGGPHGAIAPARLA